VRDLIGVAGSPGTAVGPVARLTPADPAPVAEEPSAGDAEQVTAAVGGAQQAVARDLTELAGRVEGQAVEILQAQALLVTDPLLTGRLAEEITGGASGPVAIERAFGHFAKLLSEAGGYFAERVTDLDDLRRRTLAAYYGVPMAALPEPGHPYVLVARDLSPADTAALNLDDVLAIVTEEGSSTGHTAILARDRGIPAVVACPAISQVENGAHVFVDGARGVVTVEPPGSRRVEGGPRRATAVMADLDGPCVTADGIPIPLLANLADPARGRHALASGAEGVGLFRTEFCFPATDAPPPVARQRSAYTELFEVFAGRRVVVRVLDAGADKPLPYMTDSSEPNPALGVRGLRALQRRPEILHDQLRALAEAGETTDADLWVMAPMVTDAAEARWFAQQAAEHGLNTPGVMIEIPAAAVGAERLLREVRFASIGTNDLTQYTMAADRGIAALAHRQDPWHPTVLALIDMAGRAARATGRPLGVCGEAAADPLLAAVLVGLGVRSLSMAAPAIGAVHQVIGSLTLDACESLAKAALGADDAGSAKKAVAERAGHQLAHSDR
jgi:phosphotransferase system enzyme I (PtsI)